MEVRYLSKNNTTIVWQVFDKVAVRLSDRISLATRMYTAHHSGGEPYQVGHWGFFFIFKNTNPRLQIMG